MAHHRPQATDRRKLDRKDPATTRITGKSSGTTTRARALGLNYNSSQSTLSTPHYMHARIYMGLHERGGKGPTRVTIA